MRSHGVEPVNGIRSTGELLLMPDLLAIVANWVSQLGLAGDLTITVAQANARSMTKCARGEAERLGCFNNELATLWARKPIKR